MSKISEPAREGFLYHLWDQRDFNFTLTTIDERKVIIHEKGQRNFDGGPDYLNALIQINDHLVRGDIEIHATAQDWYAHGHHNDPAYNSVILHIVTMECPPEFYTIAQNETVIPTLNLDWFLEKNAEELELEDRDPEKNESVCVFEQKDIFFKQNFLSNAGLERLKIKAERFLEQHGTTNWDQIFYQAILESLGYSKNQIPFRRLAALLPVNDIWQYIRNDDAKEALIKSEALLFGAAGFLKHHDVLDPEAKKYHTQLVMIWDSFLKFDKIVPLEMETWQFFRLRPQNFPTRRIAAAAQLICRFQRDGFVETIYRLVHNTFPLPKGFYKELERLFVVTAGTFWMRHFSFQDLAEPKSKMEKNLLGSERARDIVINTVLPGLYAYSLEIGDGHLANTIHHLFNHYPVCADNEITKKMKAIFDKTGSDGTVLNALHQQGLIHLYKNYCQKGNCFACRQKV